MAKITLSFDSVTKAGTVDVDGVAVADLDEFHLYRVDAGQFGVEMCSRVRDKQGGLYTVTRVCAAADGSLVRAEPAAPAAELTGDALKAVAALVNAR